MILYQYRSINGDSDFRYLSNLLKFGQMKFTNPSSFNDPFDCCPTLLLDDYNQDTPHELGEIINKQYQDALSIIHGIVCLSKSRNNMLMWSHYGDQHKGVCVAFDFNILNSQSPKNDLGNSLYHITKVDYSATRPDATTNAQFKQKASMWAYENEYRLISVKSKGCPAWGPSIWNVPVEAIKEIIIGARVELETQNKIIELVHSSNITIKIKKALLHNQKYKLVIKDISKIESILHIPGRALDADGGFIRLKSHGNVPIDDYLKNGVITCKL